MSLLKHNNKDNNNNNKKDKYQPPSQKETYLYITSNGDPAAAVKG